MTLPITAAQPKAGHCPEFDEIAGLHGRDKALLAILKRALDSYGKAVEAGTFTQEPQDYPATEETVKTTRTVAGPVFAALKQHFDRFDIMSTRALGREIAKVALAHHFKALNGDIS